MSKTEFCVMESEGFSSQVAIWRRGVGPWLVRLLLIYILKVRMFFFLQFKSARLLNSI